MRIPIVMPTYHNMEQFVDPSLLLMKETWPNYGDVFVISDNKKVGRFENATEIYRYDCNLSWLAGLYDGLTYFKNNFPEIKIIYLMLEDFIPLKKLDLIRLKDNEKSFIASDWNSLYFPHYENSFRFDIKQHDQSYTETPKDFLFYSQIGTGLYKLSYLITLCELAMKNKLSSPWQFELLKPETKHHISSYNWPTVRDGYFKSGFVNKDAILFLGKEKSDLKSLLTKTYFKQLPYKLYKLFFIQKIKNLNHKITQS